MARSEYKAWYDSLPKKKRQLLDKWEELGLKWTSGPCWGNKPHSVELEGYSDAGENMIVNLEDISNDALQEYIDNFDIDYNVAMWWPNGKPASGVPFDNQGEHVDDYEQWLAQMKDIILQSSGRVRKLKITNKQQVYIDRFLDAFDELRASGVGIRYSRKGDVFSFYCKTEKVV